MFNQYYIYINVYIYSIYRQVRKTDISRSMYRGYPPPGVIIM